MNTSNFQKIVKTRKDRGEEYAAKGRKLNKRARAAEREEKRYQADQLNAVEHTQTRKLRKEA